MTGESWPRALARLTGRNRRRYGGYLVHAGICVMAIAIAVSATLGSETTATLRPGEELALRQIYGLLRPGDAPDAASDTLEAADEIGLAVMATTFAIVAVFAPVGLMPGIAGQFFKQFGWTAAIRLFATGCVSRARRSCPSSVTPRLPPPWG